MLEENRSIFCNILKKLLNKEFINKEKIDLYLNIYTLYIYMFSIY